MGDAYAVKVWKWRLHAIGGCRHVHAALLQLGDAGWNHCRSGFGQAWHEALGYDLYNGMGVR
jgi:hypothetical protein